MIKVFVKSAVNNTLNLYRKYKHDNTCHQKILFYGANLMNYTMFHPLRMALEGKITSKIQFSLEDYEKNIKYYTSVGINSFNHVNTKAALKGYWDIVFLADFVSGHFRWHQCFIQIFHGVAGKKFKCIDENCQEYEFDYRFHPSMSQYGHVFFYNRDDLNNAKSLGILANISSGRVTGMPVLDQFIKKDDNNYLVSLKNKHIPKEYHTKKIFMFAPTWGNHASYNVAGSRILKVLSKIDAFVIIKPHPNCITENVPGTNKNLETFCRHIFRNGNYGIFTKSPYDLMLISDLLIADFSSISLEYTVLRKPILLYSTTTADYSASDKKQLNLLKMASRCFSEDDLEDESFLDHYKIDAEMCLAMDQIEENYFENVGRATETTVYELLTQNVLK